MKQIPILLDKAAMDSDFTIKVLLQDIIKLQEILNGTNKDFLIFDNRNGSKFEVMMDRITEKGMKSCVGSFIAWALKNRKEQIFCYQLDNKEHILRDISTQQLVANKH